MEEQKRKEIEKTMTELDAFSERHFGIRTMTTYQCLYCAKKFEDMIEAAMHPEKCEKRKEMREKNI